MDALAFFVMAVVFICYLGLAMQLTAATKDVHKRLDVQDDQIKRIADHLGVPASEVRVLPEVREALARGEKIRAIKLYRAATGSDLESATEAVDRIEAAGAQDSPS